MNRDFYLYLQKFDFMNNVRFVKKIYFSVVEGDLLRFSCLSNSLQFKVKSDKTYFFELSVFEPDDSILHPSGELCSDDPHNGVCKDEHS